MSFGSRSLPAQTAEESRRIDLIVDRNLCLTCNMVGVEIHHLLQGGLRVGHKFVIGLCPTCHAAVNRKWFKLAYGTDQHLLDRQNIAIGWPREKIRRVFKGKSTATPSKCVARSA